MGKKPTNVARKCVWNLKRENRLLCSILLVFTLQKIEENSLMSTKEAITSEKISFSEKMLHYHELNTVKIEKINLYKPLSLVLNLKMSLASDHPSLLRD